MEGREIILEWIDQGALVRVNAVDVATGEEASASGPPHAARHDLEKLAIGKLQRRLAKVLGENDRGEGGAPKPGEGGGRRGKLV